MSERWQLWLQALRQPRRLLTPTFVAEGGWRRVDKAVFASIAVVVADKDGCLCRHGAFAVPSPINALVRHLIMSHPAVKWICVSNDPRLHTSVETPSFIEVGKGVSIPILKTGLKKPLGGPEIMQALHVKDPRSVLVVGDRLGTDVLMANANGFRSLLIKPDPELFSRSEPVGIRTARRLEHTLLSTLL